MTLFMTLFPLYVFGNVHCLGMCGPLVAWICQHSARHFYFLGRLCSYSLAGLLAAEAGAILHVSLKNFHLGEIISIAGGLLIFIWGIFQLQKKTFPNPLFRTFFWQQCQQKMSQLLLKETRLATFLFGFFTVALPCGQTLVVFTACALVGDPLTGLMNGFALALITTPSLILAMQSFRYLKKLKGYDHLILGFSSIAVGILACCRGLAEAGWISHLVIAPHLSTTYHLVIY